MPKAVTLEEAKEFLQKEGADGSTAYMHLAEIVLKVLNEKPTEAHELIEHISDGLKVEIDTRRKKVPKGGEPAYRDTYSAKVFGKGQGEMMRRHEREFGYGPTAGKPFAFKTIEQKTYAIRWWHARVRAPHTTGRKRAVRAGGGSSDKGRWGGSAACVQKGG